VVPLDEPEFDRWRSAAETAFLSAKTQMDAGFFGWACFMFEQAAQFALKALLHAAGRGERTHDLTKLFKELSNAGVDLATDLEDVLKRLSRHYVLPRYPDLMPEGEPATFYGHADADQALQDAEAVIEEVDRVWGSRDA
jgi:HEPN domain-containing protein